MIDPSPPRILQVCAVDFTIRHFLLPLMRAQREWGFDVEFACSRGPAIAEIEAEGFAWHEVPIERSMNPVAHARAWRAFGKLFCARKFDAVHLHTPVAALIGRPAARRAGVPAVLYTAHGFYFHDAMPSWKRRMHIGLERRAQKHADFLMTQSAEDCSTAIEEGIAPADRVRAIGNGVDLGSFGAELLGEAERRDVLRELGIGNSDGCDDTESSVDPIGPVVTMMGRLVREKGYFEFVEAWAEVVRRHPRARALFIGEALASDRENPEASLRAEIERRGLSSSIVFAGLRGDVPRLLAASDVFVLPSWREGMPRSIIEAMASGLPVVATDIRGCREEVVDGETGFLVPVRDPAALAEKISRLAGDEALRGAMGRAGRERAESVFDERRVIDLQRGIYKSVFEAKGLAWPGD